MRRRLTFSFVDLLPMCLTRMVKLAPSLGPLVAMCLICIGVSSCGAIFPEVRTPIRALPSEVDVSDVNVPENLFIINFERAAIPKKDRAGNQWDGSGPATFARFLVDEKVRYETSVQVNSRTPTGPKQKTKTMVIEPGRKLMIELWVKQAVRNVPLCHVRVPSLESIRAGGRNVFQCDSGARIWFNASTPMPAFGLGFYYELRGHDGVKVTRVFSHSPAGRAGIRKGDRVLSLMGTPVGTLDSLEVKSLVNKNARSGLDITVISDNGAPRKLHLDEGPIYAMPNDEFPAALTQSAQ